jgi:hypothetical protein
VKLVPLPLSAGAPSGVMLGTKQPFQANARPSRGSVAEDEPRHEAFCYSVCIMKPFMPEAVLFRQAGQDGLFQVFAGLWSKARDRQEAAFKPIGRLEFPQLREPSVQGAHVAGLSPLWIVGRSDLDQAARINPAVLPALALAQQQLRDRLVVLHAIRQGVGVGVDVGPRFGMSRRSHAIGDVLPLAREAVEITLARDVSAGAREGSCKARILVQPVGKAVVNELQNAMMAEASIGTQFNCVLGRVVPVGTTRDDGGGFGRHASTSVTHTVPGSDVLARKRIGNSHGQESALGACSRLADFLHRRQQQADTLTVAARRSR